MTDLRPILKTIGLLVLSNTFMNAAWYGHLKYKTAPIMLAVLASWGLAFFEYCLQVPANRIGSESMTVTQLKVVQELLSISTFVVFAVFVFKNRPTLNTGIDFCCSLLPLISRPSVDPKRLTGSLHSNVSF